MLKPMIEGATLLALISSCATAEPQAAVAPSSGAGATLELPVREVACFKDGHAFMIREGVRPIDAQGRTVLEHLPEPVLGTFWPYASGGARVVSATASQDKVVRERTAVQLREMLRANVGAAVVLYDTNNERVEGTLVDLPLRDVSDGEARARSVNESGQVVLLRVADGLRAIPIERVRDVTFKDRDGRTYRSEEMADRLTLRVENGGEKALIGLAYVQKGLRWIPSYKIDIDGKGKAKVMLQATLVNDLIDLNDVTVNLVVGVPSFVFAGQIDPIALQQTAAQIGRSVQVGDPFSNSFSNAIMTQTGSYRGPGDTVPPSSSPTVEGAASNEDLFVYTVTHVTLKRGERMVMPVAEFTLSYKDVYTLAADVEPPFDVQAQLNRGGNNGLPSVIDRAKAVHAARLKNDSKYPLTTAPALVLASGRVLSQSLMTYTPIGADTDLELTTAVDIQVKSDAEETSRTPNAVSWDGRNYGRIDLSGTIDLTNRKAVAVDIEVRQLVLGVADAAGSGGTFEQKSPVDVWALPRRPLWWQSWSWPYWWFRWNGVASLEWKVHLEPGASVKLASKWHYFWQ